MKQVRGEDGVEEETNVERVRKIANLPAETNEEDAEEVEKSNVVSKIIMIPPMIKSMFVHTVMFY